MKSNRLNIDFEVPAIIEKADGRILGQIRIRSEKKRNEVSSLHVALEESYYVQEGSEKKLIIFLMGNWEKTTPFILDEGETQTLEFEIPFRLRTGKQADLARMKGIEGQLARVQEFLQTESSAYFLRLTASLKGMKTPHVATREVLMQVPV